ncbi:uncharacterized protein L203_105070 [Cryptococcus depauperatus CBS 7841]|uniref:Uncharacterized protein n=1 Tax=Cryptococcus depauperatus CBS 7841 TaxID=1295531 RepID=A0AAJ8JWR0_9TREE
MAAESEVDLESEGGQRKVPTQVDEELDLGYQSVPSSYNGVPCLDEEYETEFDRISGMKAPERTDEEKTLPSKSALSLSPFGKDETLSVHVKTGCNASNVVTIG